MRVIYHANTEIAILRGKVNRPLHMTITRHLFVSGAFGFFVLAVALLVDAHGDPQRAILLAGDAAAVAAALILVEVAIFAAAGGATTLDKLLAWGAASGREGAVRTIAVAAAACCGLAVGIALCAHFATHYRVRSWAALAAGGSVAVVGIGAFAMTWPFAAFVRAIAPRAWAPRYSHLLAAASLVTAAVAVVAAGLVVPGGTAKVGALLAVQTIFLASSPRLPRAVGFIATRLFLVACAVALYAHLFSVAA